MNFLLTRALEGLSLYIETLSTYEEDEKYELRIEFNKNNNQYEFGKISLYKRPALKIPGFEENKPGAIPHN
jgi:hypothetical protein